MKIRKAYKFRLKTNSEINHILTCMAGCSRFVWNNALSMIFERLQNNHKIIWYRELDWYVKLWKSSEEYAFLKSDAYSQSLQQTLKDLEKAIKDWFDSKQPNKKRPKFKKKNQHDSFRIPQNFKIKGNRIYVPKVGWLIFRKSREIEGTPKNVTISCKNGYWYASIQVELEIEQREHPSKSDIGIDMGISQFATLSDGNVYEPINSFKKIKEKLAKEQGKLAKKVKFSNNWKKQKKIISKIHTKIADMRNEHLHKTSTEISKNHAMIVMEDLRIKNMSASAKGTIESPGNHVKQKSGLNRTILDQGWGEFRRQIEYKQKWQNGMFLSVNPKNTSLKCSECGHTEKTNRKSQSKFECVSCGHKENADVNAAKNILAAGHAVLACGKDGLPTLTKQEPVGKGDRLPLLTASAA